MARRTIAGLRGVLTGASSGIGRALAVELVREGAKLVVVARREERLQALAGEVGHLSGRLEPLAGDITAHDVREAALNHAQKTFGGLDLLVNNAGIGAMGLFAEAPPERLRKVMEVNFFAAAELIRQAVPLLQAGNRPIVVNVSSILGHRGVPGYAEYCASKFALRGLSDALRVELAPLGIDVLLASPARTQTEFFGSAIGSNGKPWSALSGWPAERVARVILRAIGKGKREVVISAGGKVMVWASWWFPRLVERVLARTQ